MTLAEEEPEGLAAAVVVAGLLTAVLLGAEVAPGTPLEVVEVSSLAPLTPPFFCAAPTLFFM